MTPTTLIIIDADEARANALCNELEKNETVYAEVHGSPTQASTTIQKRSPQAVVLNLTGLEAKVQDLALRQLGDVDVPTAVFTDLEDSGALHLAMAADVGAYVVNGYDHRRVPALICLAVARYQAHRQVRAELREARKALVERKNIERAKGILMRRRGLDEKDAYDLLRRSAMNHGRSIADTASRILSAAELLD